MPYIYGKNYDKRIQIVVVAATAPRVYYYYFFGMDFLSGLENKCMCLFFSFNWSKENIYACESVWNEWVSVCILFIEIYSQCCIHEKRLYNEREREKDK